MEGCVDVDAAKTRVIEHLRSLGFSLSASGDVIATPSWDSKDARRRSHASAVEYERERAAAALAPVEPRLVGRLARSVPPVGEWVPRIVPLPRGRSEDALLWRWASLHWSVPVSGGYGRRVRYLVVDEANDGALMGIFGLTDPVFSMRARDEALGWDLQTRRTHLVHLMEANVVGAAPPYAFHLGSKLIASLVLAREATEVVRGRYSGVRTRISGKLHEGALWAVSTQGAFGRSSIYNRLRPATGTAAWKSVGFTAGTGDFQFTGEVFEAIRTVAMRELANQSGRPANSAWKSSGFRNTRDLVECGLSAMGLDFRSLRQHGVRREVLVAQLVNNFRGTLVGEAPDFRQASAEEVAAAFSDRWSGTADGRRVPEDWDWKMYGR